MEPWSEGSGIAAFFVWVVAIISKNEPSLLRASSNAPTFGHTGVEGYELLVLVLAGLYIAFNAFVHAARFPELKPSYPSFIFSMAS